MLTLIFILSLTLASLALLLMALTLRYKLPLFFSKKETEEFITYPTVRKKYYEKIDLGILEGRRSHLYNKETEVYNISTRRKDLLLEYKQIT